MRPVGEHGHRREHGRARDLARAAHPHAHGVEIEVDEVDLGERPRRPGRQPIFQRGDDPGDGALGERRGLEQRVQRAADPPLVPPGQVRRDHRLVHLAHPALVARHDRRAPLAARRLHRGAGQRERQRPGRAGQRARLDAVAVPAPLAVPLVAPGPERDRQLFVHRRLDRDPDLRMNQLAQRGRPIAHAAAPTS